MWVIAPSTKRKRNTAVTGMSIFFSGKPPSIHTCGLYGGPEFICMLLVISLQLYPSRWKHSVACRRLRTSQE